jgi:hypothetical protein
LNPIKPFLGHKTWSLGPKQHNLKKFFIADFHVLGLFMAKKHDLSEKKFSVCHAPVPLPPPPPLNAKFVPRLQPRP